MVDNISLINETVSQTAAPFYQSTLDYAQNTLHPRIVDLILAPKEHPEMLWTLGPMIIALVLMQLYFGRNKDEALGWNTAFGNSIALIFISVSLLRGLYIVSDKPNIYAFLDSIFALEDIKIIIIAALFAYGILLSTISFFHWLPTGLAFFMMNGIPINVTAYVVIVLVNSDNIPLDSHTVAAGVIIFLTVYLAAMIFRLFVPTSRKSKMKIYQKRQWILLSKEQLYERLARDTQDDAKKARMKELGREYKAKAEAYGKIIAGMREEDKM
ncbi:hypothetical protein ACFL0V_07275 [Nanoarchaeota archaeon]